MSEEKTREFFSKVKVEPVRQLKVVFRSRLAVAVARSRTVAADRVLVAAIRLLFRRQIRW